MWPLSHLSVLIFYMSSVWRQRIVYLLHHRVEDVSEHRGQNQRDPRDQQQNGDQTEAVGAAGPQHDAGKKEDRLGPAR